MVKSNKDYIYIENNVGDEEYSYIFSKSRLVSIKYSNYLNVDDFYSIEIELFRDSITLAYKNKDNMLKDFNQLKSILDIN